MDIQEAILATNEEFFGQPEEVVEETTVVEEQPTGQPTDLLQQQRDQWREAEARSSRGAKPKMKLDVSMIEDIDLQGAYKKAKDDSDYYTSIGNKQYASMIKQQYMQDKFLPVVDAMVKLNGMGAVQANQDILRQLDQLTLLDGTRGNGYTEMLVRSLYRPEEQVERSDGQVRDAVKSIRMLCETDQIRSAVGRANDIKRRIDAGENVASQDDYEVIQRVALYGEQ